MNDEHWYLALTASVAAILAIIVVALVSGCAGKEQVSLVAKATDCEGERTRAVLQSGTCAEAQAKVDGIMTTNPYCRAIYGDSGVDVCALYRKDAGK